MEDEIASCELETKLFNENRKRNFRENIKLAKETIVHNFPGITIEREYQSGNSVTLVPKKDEIGRTCPISNRQHSSNSIYFTVEKFTGMVFVKCFKPECEGRKELNLDEKLLKKITPILSISDKKKRKVTVNSKALPELDDVLISSFEHTPITLDESSCFDLYQSLNFVHVKARKQEKRPVFSGWTKNTFDENSKIKISENNVAIVTGKVSGIFVLDIDIKDGGLDWFQRFASQHKYNYTNSTLACLTPSGGVHLYFQYEDKIGGNRVRMKNREGVEIGLDIRSNDGCVIAPPSHYTNGTYSFICLKSPQTCPDFISELFTCDN